MRRIDWNRSYASNFGAGGTTYSQDGVEFDQTGNEITGERPLPPPEEEPENRAGQIRVALERIKQAKAENRNRSEGAKKAWDTRRKNARK